MNTVNKHWSFLLEQNQRVAIRARAFRGILDLVLRGNRVGDLHLLIPFWKCLGIGNPYAKLCQNLFA